MAAPYQYIQNEKMRGQGAEGSVDLYIGLQPKDSIESILAGLIVSVSNATHDCLSQAARAPVQELQHRDLNLRHGLKGAVVAARLIDAYERVRGNRPGNNVSVGKVNVEAGGQAIVGTVQASPREQEPSSPTGPHAVKTRATK